MGISESVGYQGITEAEIIKHDWALIAFRLHDNKE